MARCPRPFRHFPPGLSEAFSEFAGPFVARFPPGCSLWLVGSALSRPAPRDYDLRLLMPGSVFSQAFGSLRLFMFESRCGLRSRRVLAWESFNFALCEEWEDSLAVAGFPGLLVDFQVHPPPVWRFWADSPRARVPIFSSSPLLSVADTVY